MRRRKVGGMRATGVAHIKIALRGMEGMRQGVKERSKHINGHKQCAETLLQQPATQWTAGKGGQRKSKHGNEHLELIYLKASFSSHFLWHSRSWLAIKTTLWINYVPGMVYGLFNCTALHPITLLIAQHFLQLGSPSSADCMLLLSLFLLCF